MELDDFNYIMIPSAIFLAPMRSHVIHETTAQYLALRSQILQLDGKLWLTIGIHTNAVVGLFLQTVI